MGAVGRALVDGVQCRSEVRFADTAGPGRALVAEEEKEVELVLRLVWGKWMGLAVR